MKIKQTILTSFASAVSLLVLSTSTMYAEATKVPTAIITSDTIETKVGTLHFNDGYPTKATAAKIRDELDYIHGVDAFMNSIQRVSLVALRKGFADAGIKDRAQE